MKSRILLISIFFAIFLFVLYHYFKYENEYNNQQIRTKQTEDTIKTEVINLGKRHNAIVDWRRQLIPKEQLRLSPILTIELEKLWQTERPILFIGTIKDIVSINQNTYRILLENTSLDFDISLSTKLRLSLASEKSIIDSFLESHPNFLFDGVFNNNVAVIGKVREISAINECAKEDSSSNIRIGEGTLVEIIYANGTSLQDLERE